MMTQPTDEQQCQGFGMVAQARNIGNIHTFGALNPQVRADWIVSRSG
jgi:hypothetical protein